MTPMMSVRTQTGTYQKVKKILLSNGNESSEGESEYELEPPDTDKKYLVFSNCLDQLLKRCPKCGVAVTGQKKENNWEYANYRNDLF